VADFTKGELEVMRILWEHGEMKPPDIQDMFPRAIKNSALRSYLTILLEKGHVTRNRDGKAYYYKAKTAQSPVFHSMLRDMVNTFFSGSKEALLCRLIKSENLSKEELLELKKLSDKGTQTPHQREGESK
jgi:BlaI family transcriptional regulator, penicillinase repressor